MYDPLKWPLTKLILRINVKNHRFWYIFIKIDMFDLWYTFNANNNFKKILIGS